MQRKIPQLSCTIMTTAARLLKRHAQMAAGRTAPVLGTSSRRHVLVEPTGTEVLHRTDHEKITPLQTPAEGAPGITSWDRSSTVTRRTSTRCCSAWKFDILYIENMSLARDFKILVLYDPVLLQGREVKEGLREVLCQWIGPQPPYCQPMHQ